jgi:GTPase SAR1 family protein
LKELRSNSSPDTKIFLIGNKCDLKDERVISYEKGQKVQSDYNLDLFLETSAKSGFNTELLFAKAARLLYNDYIKYKIGNPLIGKSGLESKKSNKLSKTNDNSNKKKKCC